MKIGLAGPVATENIKCFLNSDTTDLPKGYPGAPLFKTLIDELLARGHHVSVYTTSVDLSLDLHQPVVARGERFKIYYCPSRKHSIRMNGKYFGRIVDGCRLEKRNLLQAFRMDEPDIIHAHWAYEFALAAIASGKPHIVTCHDAPQEILKYMTNVYRFGRYFMALKAMRSANQLTTVSPYLRDKLVKLAGQELTVIPNPIPSIIFQRPFDSSRKLKVHSPNIMMVANGWDTRKNTKAGMLAFAELRSKIYDVRLRLCGSGYGVGEIAHTWAKNQGITEGMEFIGGLPYDVLLEEMATADLFLHPSLEESFGMVVAEAMALGVPVVGGKTSGAVPWVIGDGGVLADMTNPAEITAVLNTVLTDQEKWQELRSIAYESSHKRFSPAEVTDAYETLYNQQLKEF